MIHRWTSPVMTASGVTCQHQAVSRLNLERDTGNCRCDHPNSSQSNHNWNWALAVISGRCWVVDAPQCLHRHRVRPAVVFPFLTSLYSHIPQRGRLSTLFTLHAFTACTRPYLPNDR